MVRPFAGSVAVVIVACIALGSAQQKPARRWTMRR